MTRRFFTSRRIPWPSASVFAADFSACCTWRSPRSGWSANSASTSSPPRPACVTASPQPPDVVEVDSPTKFPPPNEMAKIEEPVITAMIITAEDSVGGILQLCEEKRGVQKNFEYLSPQRVMLTYELPLNEIVLDFYDRLKSASRGYASLDYHLAGYKEADLVKLD